MSTERENELDKWLPIWAKDNKITASIPFDPNWCFEFLCKLAVKCHKDESFSFCLVPALGTRCMVLEVVFKTEFVYFNAGSISEHFKEAVKWAVEKLPEESKQVIEN
jgi:hypothetical protein